jgi:SGNH hydrolase-like domain, acetyltransferase AlgX
MIGRRGGRPSSTAELSRESAEGRTPTYEGCLQGVGNGNVLGWCWDPAAPEERVQIAIAVDGETVAEGTADISRPDLAEFGDGAHGFLLSLPDSLQAPGRHRVLVLAGPERAPIAASPSFWHEATSGNGWSDVVFEPGDPLPSGTRPTDVPEPPEAADLRAVALDGWLFDASEFEPRPRPTPADLDAGVSTLAATAEACAAVGLRYVPVVVPAKRRVLGGAPPLDRRWVGELRARLHDVDDVDLLDLLPILRHAARHGAAYNRTDSDWNARGAFFVARAMLKEAHKWAPELRPPAFADLHLCPVTEYRGTLADAPKHELVAGELAPRELDVEAEEGILIDASHLHALRMPVESHLAEAGSTHTRVYANPEMDEGARLAIVGDAVSLSLVPWLAERARRTTFFWSPALPLHELELDLPPVVFHLIREADLLGTAPSEAIIPLAEPTPAHLSPSPPTPGEAAFPEPTSPSAHPDPGPPTPHGEGTAARTPTAAHEAPPPGLAPLPLLYRMAMPDLARRTHEAPTIVRATLRSHAWTIALVALITALSWPVGSVNAGGGLDNSWVVGLNLAVAHGLAFGRQVIFTYGPLGFGMFPTAVTPGTFFAGEVLVGLIQLALVAVLLAILRRRMNLFAASVLTLLAASLVGWRAIGEPLYGIAFGLVALTFAIPAARREQAFRRLAIGGGAFADFALLVKLNGGVAACAILAVGLLGSDWRRRNLTRAAASFLGTLVALWLLVGEPLGALPAYLRNSYQVIGGYVEAMGLSPGAESQWQLLLVVGSAIVLAIGAWRALETERPRRGAALAGAVLVVHYFVAREAFIRYGPGHFATIALLCAVALMIPWPRAQRATGFALAALMAVAVFAVLARPVSEIVNPLGDAHQFLTQASEVLHPGASIAEGRKSVKQEDAVPLAMARALRGHCVNAEPDEIAAVWAHPGWRWCPLPVFQSYSAYTPRLDHLNAAAYADPRHGPDRVLRQANQAIDGRNPTWESPAAMLSLLCHFTEIEHSEHLQTLARIPDRCGTPHTIEVVHSSLGHTITLPSPPAGAVMVASIDGLQVAGWERLESLFTRAAPRYVTVNGTAYRVPPGTADDGLVIAVPADADYPAPFNLDMDPHTLQATVAGHSTGAITVTLSAIPIAPLPPVPSTPAAASATESPANEGFQADTHHLPWVYEGQKLLTPKQILSLPEEDRELVDTTLLKTEALPLESPSTSELHAAVPAQVRHAPAMHVAQAPTPGTSHGCTLLIPTAPGNGAIISVAPGHGLYLTMHTTGKVSVYARRYANHVPTEPLHVIPTEGTPAIVRFPPDTGTQPWHVRLVPTTPTAVCVV